MAVRSRFHTAAVPGTLALTVLVLTGCTSQGTVGAGAAGGPGSPSTSNPASASGSTSASGPASTSGTPSGGDKGTAAPTTPATGSSPAAPSSQDPSALASSLKVLNQLWTDPGCKTMLSGFSDYLYASQKGQAQGDAAIPAAVKKIRLGAQQTKRPGAAQEMNKMAGDLLAMHTEAQQGKTPNKGPLHADWQIAGNECSQP
jgi:hypothetical protein